MMYCNLHRFDLQHTGNREVIIYLHGLQFEKFGHHWSSTVMRIIIATIAQRPTPTAFGVPHSTLDDATNTKWRTCGACEAARQRRGRPVDAPRPRPSSAWWNRYATTGNIAGRRVPTAADRRYSANVVVATVANYARTYSRVLPRKPRLTPFTPFVWCAAGEGGGHAAPKRPRTTPSSVGVARGKRPYSLCIIIMRSKCMAERGVS